MFSPPPPDPVVSPKKTIPVALSTSPPKQKEFNVQRKPLELNSLIKDDIKIAEMIKNKLKDSENSNQVENSSSITDKPTSPTRLTKLATPPAVPKKPPVQVTSPVPIDNKSNNKNDTNM